MEVARPRAAIFTGRGRPVSIGSKLKSTAAPLSACVRIGSRSAVIRNITRTLPDQRELFPPIFSEPCNVSQLPSNLIFAQPAHRHNLELTTE